MNLHRLPSDGGTVLDLDRVAYVESAALGSSGSVLFSDAILDVEILAGWMIYLGVEGKEFAWSGTEHASEDEAQAELSAVAATVGWKRVPIRNSPWVTKRERFDAE